MDLTRIIKLDVPGLDVGQIEERRAPWAFETTTVKDVLEPEGSPRYKLEVWLHEVDYPLTVIYHEDRDHLEALAEKAVKDGIWVDGCLYPGHRITLCKLTDEQA